MSSWSDRPSSTYQKYFKIATKHVSILSPLVSWFLLVAPLEIAFSEFNVKELVLTVFYH